MSSLLPSLWVGFLPGAGGLAATATGGLLPASTPEGDWHLLSLVSGFQSWVRVFTWDAVEVEPAHGEPGRVSRESRSHTLVSFCKARFTRGDLPMNLLMNLPMNGLHIEGGGGGASVIETSRMSIRCEILAAGCVCRWRGGCGQGLGRSL